MTHADLLVHGDRVHTLEPDRPRASWVAVREGRIAAVGDDRDQARSLIGPTTEVLDLPGAMVLPGFIDTHFHYVAGPLTAGGISLTEAHTHDDLVATLRAHASQANGAVLRGFGWRSHLFPHGPDRSLLDEIFGDRPVLLTEINAHSVWASTRALRDAGIDRDTPDPVPGYSYFARDESREPTGWVLEDAGSLLQDRLVPADAAQAREDLLAMTPAFSAAGLTGVFDAGIVHIDEEAGWRLLTELDHAGDLPQRIVASHIANDDPDNAVAVLQEAARTHRSRNVRIATLKIFVDGVTEGHTSAYLHPYDDQPGDTGPLALPAEVVRDLVVATDAAGFQCHLHALGDRAVRVSLDAIEAARHANGHSGIRHVVCHAHLVDPADLPRFQALDVVYQTSGQWIEMDPFHEVMEQRLGDRALRQFPLQSAIARGATVTLGADFPATAYVSTFQPLVQIETAVTRRPAGQPDAPPLPPVTEALTLPQALAAMTSRAAHQLHQENRTGSLTPGKDADLVVLGHDLFAMPSHEIAATPVLLTMRGGEITHAADA